MRLAAWISLAGCLTCSCGEPPCAPWERKVAKTCLALEGTSDSGSSTPVAADAGGPSGGSDSGVETGPESAHPSGDTTAPVSDAGAESGGPTQAQPGAEAVTAKEYVCPLPRHCATWPMPDRLGKFAPGLVRDPEVVRDLVTGMVWQAKLEFNGTYPDAERYCDALVLAGQSDWRLPSLIELISLFDVTHDVPTIDPNFFPDEPADYPVWAAKTVDQGREVSYSVYAGGAGTALKYFLETLGSDASDRARCVRGGKDPEGSRYLINSSEGTVSDRWTGLVWKREIEMGVFTLAEAQVRCQQHGEGWRLPTVKELVTLVSPVTSDPAIDTEAFPQTPSEKFWSSSATYTRRPAGNDIHRVVDFGVLAVSPNVGIGAVEANGGDRRLRVRCMR